jgi:uncharacterized phage protein gp47/JayE
MFGLTTSGFILKTLADIAAETAQDFQAEYGSEIDLSPEEPLGQLKGIFDERFSLLWELADQVHSNISAVNEAEGVNLDKLVDLNGITRIPSTPSRVTVTIAGTPLVSIPNTFEVSVAGNPTARFRIGAATQIGAGGTVDAEFFSIDNGPIAAPMNSLTVIETPITGVDTTDNGAAAILGRETETDAELKIRREEFLQGAQGATDIGIATALLEDVSGVTSAVVRSNRTNLIDPEGRPPKSFEALVQGGANIDIANKILEVQPAGIESFGNITESVTDIFGFPQTIMFSRPTSISMIAQIDITPNTDASEGNIYPVDGDDQVKDAVKAYFDALKPGNDVINNATYTNINQIPGVIGIVAQYAKTGDPLTPNNIPISFNELAVIDLADIVVNS